LFDVTAHRDAVAGGAFAPGGRLLVTYGADCSAHVWRVPSGQLAAFFAADAGLTAAAFSADGGTWQPLHVCCA
jgi:WD40 repeat protein